MSIFSIKYQIGPTAVEMNNQPHNVMIKSDNHKYSQSLIERIDILDAKMTEPNGIMMLNSSYPIYVPQEVELKKK